MTQPEENIERLTSSATHQRTGARNIQAETVTQGEAA